MKMQVALHPRIFGFRPRTLPLILVVLMASGSIVAMVRFVSGIGAISNLSNIYPWGFWISFDIYTGIAISSGAFLLASAVYVFDLKELRPLLMPSVLTALIGYFMEVLALMVDLGRPERIFNMLFYQNFTSWMLVVGLCVMIYLAILAVEFAPVFFKGTRQPKWEVVFRKLLKPAVILGVVVSTIHQGSLGTLLLIQSAKLHPIWWTPLLPILFFLSSIPIGLAMVIFESSMSSRYFGRGIEIHLLERLAKAIPYALGLYAVVRFGQIAAEGKLGLLFSSGMHSARFWAEIVLGVAVPIIVFLSAQNRRAPKILLVGAIALLLGMILNRFDVSWLGIRRLEEVSYLPSLAEVLISAAIFSSGIMAFGLAAKYLPVFEHHEATASAATD